MPCHVIRRTSSVAFIWNHWWRQFHLQFHEIELKTNLDLEWRRRGAHFFRCSIPIYIRESKKKKTKNNQTRGTRNLQIARIDFLKLNYNRIRELIFSIHFLRRFKLNCEKSRFVFWTRYFLRQGNATGRQANCCPPIRCAFYTSNFNESTVKGDYSLPPFGPPILEPCFHLGIGHFQATRQCSSFGGCQIFLFVETFFQFGDLQKFINYTLCSIGFCLFESHLVFIKMSFSWKYELNMENQPVSSWTMFLAFFSLAVFGFGMDGLFVAQLEMLLKRKTMEELR